jgi:hypothetical protein
MNKKNWKETWFGIKTNHHKTRKTLDSRVETIDNKEPPIETYRLDTYDLPIIPMDESSIQYVKIQTNFEQIFMWTFQVCVSLVCVTLLFWGALAFLFMMGCSAMFH